MISDTHKSTDQSRPTIVVGIKSSFYQILVYTRSAYLDYNLFNLYVAMFENDNVVTDEVKLINR
jgi:hypothetical protein